MDRLESKPKLLSVTRKVNILPGCCREAVRELREEIRRISPHGKPLSEIYLAKATENLNNLIRCMVRSATELWTKRDKVTGAELLVNDEELSDQQFTHRTSSHKSSARYEARNSSKLAEIPDVEVGDQVYVKSDLTKSKARDPFLVIGTDKPTKEATLQKIIDNPR